MFLAGVFLTACGATTSTKPSDQVLDKDIFTQATASGSIDRCKDIKDNTLAASCEQVVNDKRVTNSAISALDKKECGKVSDARYKIDCEIQIDAKIEAKNEEAKRASIEKDAQTNNDPKICDQIKSENQKASCKFNVLSIQALKQKDPSICDGIGLKELVDKCKLLVNQGK